MAASEMDRARESIDAVREAIRGFATALRESQAEVGSGDLRSIRITIAPAARSLRAALDPVRSKPADELGLPPDQAASWERIRSAVEAISGALAEHDEGLLKGQGEQLVRGAEALAETMSRFAALWRQEAARWAA